MPFQSIISLFEVHLNCHVTLLAFFLLHGVDELLDNNHVIHTFPTRNKSSLKRRDQLVQHGSNPINKHLSDEFVYRIAKANRPKQVQAVGPRAFGNKSDESLIQVVWH